MGVAEPVRRFVQLDFFANLEVDSAAKRKKLKVY
jgi:hypothetical protein